MTDTLPPPNASGYQPADGEGFAWIDVEVRPSFGFQTVGITGRLVFPEPRSYTEALPAIDDAYQALEEEARARVASLVEHRDAFDGRPKTQAPAAPAAAPQPAAAPPVDPAAFDSLVASQLGGAPATPTSPTPSGSDPSSWPIGSKPNGKGTFRYRPSSEYPSPRFIEDAKAAVAAQGVPADDVVVFDDRVGKYGLEDGNESWSVGKAKARDNTQLKQIMGARDTVAYIDFDERSGGVRAALSKDAKAALDGIRIARQLAGNAEEVPF